MPWVLRATPRHGAVSFCASEFASEGHGQPYLETARARLGLKADVEMIKMDGAPEGALPFPRFAPQRPAPPEPPKLTMAEQLLYEKGERQGYPILFGVKCHLHFGPWTSQRTGWAVCDERGEPFPLSLGYHKTGAIIAFMQCLDLPDTSGDYREVRRRWWGFFRRRGFSLKKFKLVEVVGKEDS